MATTFATTTPTFSHAPAGIASRAATRPAVTMHGLLRAGVRLVIGAIATGIAATGLAILTRPLAIPVTVTLWLAAAALIAFAIAGRLPER
jgi:hypothetical protein